MEREGKKNGAHTSRMSQGIQIQFGYFIQFDISWRRSVPLCHKRCGFASLRVVYMQNSLSKDVTEDEIQSRMECLERNKIIMTYNDRSI